MSYGDLNNALLRRYLTEFSVYSLRVKRKEKCIFRNAITLQVNLRNEILGNNDLLKVAST